GTTTLAVTDSGSNTNLDIEAKGTGTLGVGLTSTGAITIGNSNALGINLTSKTANPIAYTVAGVNTFTVYAADISFTPSATNVAGTIRYNYTPAADAAVTIHANGWLSTWD